MRRCILVLFWSSLCFAPLHAVNILSVQDPGVYGTKPGYIDKATLVIEPHGSHVEQSLYLEYSDHGQFTSNKQLQVIHRFNLPELSVINDLWLWIGDSVMQAIMMDTWTARAIYDSIVNVRRDPAFLSKKGNQYELDIYPLFAGDSRKVKINYITPCRWVGEKASIPLPLRMLQANNASQQPLHILFKTKDAAWGKVQLAEHPDLSFSFLKDTVDYRYDYLYLEDIRSADQLTCTFSPEFENGVFAHANQKPGEKTYYQFGFSPGSFFDLPIDSSSQTVLVGLDYSSTLYRDLDRQIPQISKTLKSALKPGDEFKLLIAGEGKIQSPATEWLPGTDDAIDGCISEFLQSDLAQTLKLIQKPHIVYADPHAAMCWKFPGIEEMATWTRYSDTKSAIPYIHTADVFAAYDHGHDQLIDQSTLESLLAPLESLFLRGGRLLSFYDYNRKRKELLASYYIKGLTTNKKISGDLFRNMDGNIGRFFPESIYHPVINLLEWDEDPDVKIELMDKNGRAAVISKKIKNGLLVVSGLWAFKDDGALRAQLGVPLLGLSSLNTHPSQLSRLLDSLQTIDAVNPCNKVFLFSNSDSLYPESQIPNLVENVKQGFEIDPNFYTVNLIDATTGLPPLVTINEKIYYGSGYFLQSLAAETRGIHFETAQDDWEFISALMDFAAPPLRERIKLTVDGQNASHLTHFLEVDPVMNDPLKPIFFIGSHTNDHLIEFSVNATFSNIDQIFTQTTTVPVHHDTSLNKNIIASMLGFEELKNLYQTSPEDTATIVDLSMQYNLLSDYTALLALEPNDTLHFMKNPLDEGGFTRVETIQTDKDTLDLNIFPNPFNSQTTINITVPEQSEVKVVIYNIRGQKVKTLWDTSAPYGRQSLVWDGKDEQYRTVSSGLYFVQITAVSNTRTLRKTKRITFLR
ncbi:T9SS type A sorting domain-containing protein [candidate division KSB1 bacterium]|nr:T9SS type A sorting domain-containing protein [candidate division KSB1 bacterium]